MKIESLVGAAWMQRVRSAVNTLAMSFVVSYGGMIPFVALDPGGQDQPRDAGDTAMNGDGH